MLWIIKLEELYKVPNLQIIPKTKISLFSLLLKFRTSFLPVVDYRKIKALT
jgi:hypothetical protein